MSDIRPVRPGLWLVETAVEDFDVRGVVVAGREKAVIWDTLARPADMAGVAELVPGLPLTVVYSHGDWDHAWGTAGLSRPWSEILAHESCVGRFASELPGTLGEKRTALPGAYDEVVLAPPTRTFRDALSLDLGGLTLEIFTLPGHTPDSVVGVIPEWGIFLAGDAVETPLPFLNAGSPVETWARGLERWARWLEEWRGGAPGSTGPLVIPSHGPVGGAELLRGTGAYLRDLLQGREPNLPAAMPPFYVQTHEANRALIRREGEPCP